MMGDPKGRVGVYTEWNLHCWCQRSEDVDISLHPSRTEVQSWLPSEDQSGEEREKKG